MKPLLVWILFLHSRLGVLVHGRHDGPKLVSTPPEACSPGLEKTEPKINGITKQSRLTSPPRYTRISRRSDWIIFPHHENFLERNFRDAKKIPTREGLARKKFTCDIDGCKKQYSRGANLQRHQKSAHSENPPVYKCDVEGCRAPIYRAQESLRRHKIEKHSEKFTRLVCTEPNCFTTFSQKGTFRRHLVSRTSSMRGLKSIAPYTHLLTATRAGATSA